MTLTPEDRARIEAEEAYRAEIRQRERVKNRPAFIPGILLNVLIVGLGLAYLGRWWYTLLYIALAVLISVFFTPFVGWPVALLVSTLHYSSEYDQLYPEKVDSAEDARQDAIFKGLLTFIAVVLVVGGLILSQR